MNHNVKASGSPTRFGKGLYSRMILECRLLHTARSIKVFRFLQGDPSVILEKNLGSKIEVNLYNMVHIPHFITIITMAKVRHLRKIC